MKYPTYNHSELEPEILKFWQDKKIVEKLRERNKKGKKFYFLEGPPYTSGRVHLGTAWNMALKDIILRYKRAKGLNVWDRMGYDMHGLPTEQKVMAKLKLKNKSDIEKYGLKKFTDECEKFCVDMMHQMNQDFIQLGSTIDFTDPYQPIKKEFMEAEWWLIKKAHEKGRLYQGLRTMHWDAATQSSVAKHELEYKSVNDTSIYVKFPDKKNPKRFFLIWTTTPWTIPLNLAIMVNPGLDYVDVSVNDEVWVIAKELLEQVMEKVMGKAGIEKYKIIKTYKGKELDNQLYSHPLNIIQYLPEELQNNPKLFSILLSKEYVDLSAGTGLVHCAPGCGPEDYEVGHRNKIPPFNCVNEEGLFAAFGQFTNWKAKIDDHKFIQVLDEAKVLVAKEPYIHDYPYGERSHQPVIFRTTKQWFFKVEDLKQKMLKANKKIKWNPEGGDKAFTAWLENLRDNSITKQRYWGTPVPIWMAENEEPIIIGSITELEKLSGEKVKNMHIPDIDKITITKNGKKFTRIPDVLDVWIDAGTVSWNCLNYPHEKKEFDNLFPADFILEGKDQIRGWFNLLMVASFLAFDKPSFKNVYMHGFLNDISGVKMSKSLGNIISPDELIEKHGADVLRYYMSQTNAGHDMNFSKDECVVKQRQLHILWNLHKFLINLAKENAINPYNSKAKEIGFEEKYIISKLHSTIKYVTELFESYRLDETILPLEELYLELSRTYIQMVRDKSTLGTKDEKETCINTIYTVLIECLKMFSVITPFISESIYLNFKDEFELNEESISHYEWPKADTKKIDQKLEKQFSISQQIIQASLNSREKAKLGLRWPVKEIIIVSQADGVKETVDNLKEIIRLQTNTKEIKLVKHLPELKVEIKPNFGKIGPAYGKLSPQIIAKLAAENSEKIMGQINKSGEYNFDISGEKIVVSKDMLSFEHEVPTNYQESEFKEGFIYLNTERNEELETEGYARELMRQIQSSRKTAGLEKADSINLVLQVSANLNNRLGNFEQDIKDKVGANEIEITVTKPSKKLKHNAEFKVKNEEFSIWFDKV